MSKFLKKIAFFIFPLIIFIFGFDLYLRNINTLYKEKVKGLLSNKDSIEILILGNSRAHYGIDPNQFNLDAYNLANVSQTLYFDKRLILKHLNFLPKLKYVLISIEHHSLYSSSQGVRDVWSYYGHGIQYKDKSYLRYDISPFLFGYTPKVSFSLFKKNILKALKFKGEYYVNFDVEHGVNLRDTIEKGYISFEGTNEAVFNSDDIKLSAGKDTLSKKMIKEQKEILRDLEDVITILKDNGIMPILFSTPCYHEYNTYLNQEIIQNNEKAINRLCEKFDIKFLDYSDSDQFFKSDFYNCDHLNKKGGAKFANILNQRLSDIQ